MHPFKSVILIVFLFSVMVYLGSCIKGLFGGTQVIAHLTWKMEYILSVFVLINGLFSTYLSVILLWMFSIVCFYTTDELKKNTGKGETLTLKNVRRLPSKEKKVTVSSTADSIKNAEKFIELFQVWLYEEENISTESEPLEQKIDKLRSACKQLKRVQIIIDSLKTRILYCSPKGNSKYTRIRDLLNKFDYVTAYMELRQYMLTLVGEQFLAFLEQGKEVKIWLSDVVEFQERLHHVKCDRHLVVQQQISQTQVIGKQSKMIAGKLETYENTGKQLTATLQEMELFSNSFRIALRKEDGKHQKRWSDTLRNSVTEEMTQVAERFSTVLKLNACYQTHLQGLLLDLLLN